MMQGFDRASNGGQTGQSTSIGPQHSWHRHNVMDEAISMTSNRRIVNIEVRNWGANFTAFLQALWEGSPIDRSGFRTAQDVGIMDVSINAKAGVGEDLSFLRVVSQKITRE